MPEKFFAANCRRLHFVRRGGERLSLRLTGDRAHLGETLVLPPWLGAEHGAIEATLPRVVVRVPSPAGAPE